jgi:hypothetical protein
MIASNVAYVADVKILALYKPGDDGAAHAMTFGLDQAPSGNAILCGCKRFYQTIAGASVTV